MKQITVKVKEEKEPFPLRMTTHYGDGTLGKVKFDAAFVLPTFALQIKIGKKQYLVDQRDVIEQVALNIK